MGVQDDAPEVPPEFEFIWSAYSRLRTERHYQPNGPQAITSPQIESWARLRGIRFAGWELDALHALDLLERKALLKTAK